MGNVGTKLVSKSPQEICIPSIVLFELEVGIAKSTSPDKRIKQLHEIVSLISIIPFGEKEAHISAHIRATLEKKGTPIGSYDLLIGGTAVANKATLVSRNIKEFERIESLQIEDWF